MCAAMLRATSAAPRFFAVKGETCAYSVPTTTRRIVQNRPVHCTGQMVERELPGERVDHRIELL